MVYWISYMPNNGKMWDYTELMQIRKKWTKPHNSELYNGIICFYPHTPLCNTSTMRGAPESMVDTQAQGKPMGIKMTYYVKK